jgi:hypothetical protein
MLEQVLIVQLVLEHFASLVRIFFSLNKDPSDCQ